MIRRRQLRSLLLSVALLPALALAASERDQREREVERSFKSLERRLWGSDAEAKAGCSGVSVTLEDRPLETDHHLELKRSSVVLDAPGAALLRRCVRSLARAGIIEGWTLRPDHLELTLLRAHREPAPRSELWHHPEEDREAAEALSALWKRRHPVLEALPPELLAPDFVELDSAQLLGGNLEVTGRAPDSRFAGAYHRLVAELATNLRVDWHLDLTGAEPGSPPPMAEEGELRAALREAPPSAILRLLADLDARDFVVPSGGERRSGAIGGGWEGVFAKLARDRGLEPARVGPIDVFAPAGVVPPGTGPSGRPVTLELEAVEPRQLYHLLSAVEGSSGGLVRVEGPAGTPLEVSLHKIPSQEALAAARFEEGDAHPANLGTLPPAVTTTAGSLSPLERAPATGLRVVALGHRAGRWRAIVETPDGKDVLTRTGTRLGREGIANVDEHGVAVVIERYDADGHPHWIAAPLPF